MPEATPVVKKDWRRTFYSDIANTPFEKKAANIIETMGVEKFRDWSFSQNFRGQWKEKHGFEYPWITEYEQEMARGWLQDLQRKEWKRMADMPRPAYPAH